VGEGEGGEWKGGGVGIASWRWCRLVHSIGMECVWRGYPFTLSCLEVSSLFIFKASGYSPFLSGYVMT